MISSLDLRLLVETTGHDCKPSRSKMADDPNVAIIQDHMADLPVVGKTKRFMFLEKNEWLFLGLSVVNILIAVGLTIARIVEFVNDSKKDHSMELTFAILLLFNAAFCLFYAIHGVLREREYELYVYIVAVIVLLCYVVVNICISQSTIKWVRFGLLIGFGLPNIYYGYKVGMDFGYLEFKTVGASVEVQLMYRKACRFSGLIKFTVQVGVSLLVLGIIDPQNLTNEDKICVAAGIPFLVFWGLIGWIAMRKESKLLCWFFVALALVAVGYMIYKVVYISNEWEKAYKNTDTNSPRWLAYVFFGACVIALLVLACLMLSMKYVMDNFGKGLKELVFTTKGDNKSQLARKKEIIECCGIVCCGPIG